MDLGHTAAMAGTESDRTVLQRLARTYLEPDVATRWSAMLRPAVDLVPVEGRHEHLARFGGLPQAPVDFVWPRWDPLGTLTFVAEVDLAAVAAAGLDPGIVLPVHGRLLAFYYDGTFRGDGEGIVTAGDPDSLAGARLVHVEAGAAACVEHPAPPDVRVLPERLLAGRQATTAPDPWHPTVAAMLGRDDPDHPESEPWEPSAFVDALIAFDEARAAASGRHLDQVGHRLGGWADQVQGAVEDEAAQGVLRSGWGDLDAAARAAHEAEARRWTPLLQIGSEPALDVMWDDLGVLYWLARRERLPLLDEVTFTTQCG